MCVEFGTENERVSTSLCALSLVQRMKGQVCVEIGTENERVSTSSCVLSLV